MTGLRVEFCGAPGAGKTTLATAVAERLDGAGHAVDSPARRIASTQRPRRIAAKALLGARRALREPTATAAEVRTLARTDQQGLADLVRVTFNWQFVRELACRHGTGGDARAHDVILYDQGIFQALWSVGFSAADDWAAMRRLTLPAGCLPDLLVVVRADAGTLAARLAEREGGDTRVEETRHTVERSIVGIDHLQDLAAEYERAGGRPAVLVVENSTPGPPEAVVERVTGAIETRL